MRALPTIAGLSTALALSTVPLSAEAQSTPSNLRDLIDVRSSSGESDLQSRGYVFIKTSRSEDRIYANWWNPSLSQCIVVQTADGRYASIVDSPAVDCGHQNAAAKNNNHAGAAVAVGAAALIGALVLEHNSHHHEAKSHANTSQAEAAFERGYRDGLYNATYHNYDRSKDYENGYSAGVTEREDKLSHQQGHSGGSGYRPSVNVADLRGARASGADSDMRRRGFNDVDAFKSGTSAYTIWYNGRTRQCIQMTVADGSVYDIRDIGSHPQCR